MLFWHYFGRPLVDLFLLVDLFQFRVIQNSWKIYSSFALGLKPGISALHPLSFVAAGIQPNGLGCDCHYANEVLLRQTAAHLSAARGWRAKCDRAFQAWGSFALTRAFVRRSTQFVEQMLHQLPICAAPRLPRTRRTERERSKENSASSTGEDRGVTALRRSQYCAVWLPEEKRGGNEHKYELTWGPMPPIPLGGFILIGPPMLGCPGTY